MADRGNLLSNPNLQVGSRLIKKLGSRRFHKVLSLCLIASLAIVAPSAEAATKKPTPAPSAKATVKTTAKATTSTTAKATAKASAKPTKKAVVKKKKKAKVRVTPSPKTSWPPKGFRVEGEVYAKVPTAKELVGFISANTYLAKQIKQCTTYICGAVQVASETGCLWWEAIANVSDAQGLKLGELNTSFTGTAEREFKVLLMISPETVEKGGAANVTSVICHHEDRDTSLPGISYKKY